MSVISDKFKKELIKFFEWVEYANYTVSKDNIEQEWSVNLGPGYTEPGRYKLIVFIEEILKNYKISLDDTNIIDAKQMVTNFKNYKPVKSKKESPKKECKSPKKESKSPKKESKSPKKVKKIEFVNDITLDTSCNGMLCELEFTTKELENIFGCKATFTGNELTDHRYEWKFMVNNIVYSIYDWAYIDNTFDEYIDNQWFLGGDVDDYKLIKEALVEASRNVKSDAYILTL